MTPSPTASPTEIAPKVVVQQPETEQFRMVGEVA